MHDTITLLSFIAAACPTGWLNRANQSCYLVVTPGTTSAAQTQSEAGSQCKTADERAQLVSLESDSEADFVASILRRKKSRKTIFVTPPNMYLYLWQRRCTASAVYVTHNVRQCEKRRIDNATMLKHIVY